MNLSIDGDSAITETRNQIAWAERWKGFNW